MGLLTTLEQYKNINKPKEKKENTDKERKQYFDYHNYLKLTDGDVVTLRFAQEIDADGDNYDPEVGQGIIAIEHSPQEVYPRKIYCTASEDDGEGDCYGCERAAGAGDDREKWFNWRQKYTMYINVIVEQSDGSEKVMVLNRAHTKRSFTNQIIDWAAEQGTITNLKWKLKREGSTAQDTVYTLTPLVNTLGKVDTDYKQYDLFDLDTCLNHVPYEYQEKSLVGHLANEPEELEEGPTDQSAW